MLLGLVFIVLTNIFAVYSPTLIEEGIGVLGEAQKTYFDAIDFTEDGPKIPDGLFEQPGPELPTSIQFLADLTGASTAFSKGIDSYDRLGSFLVRVGLLLAVLYIIVYLIKGVFLFFTRQTIIVMSRLIEYDQKNEIYAHYQKLSMAFYRRNNTGDLMNRISEDVSKVRMSLGPAGMYSLNLVVLVVMVVGKMFMVDPELSLYALSPLPFMSVAIYYISNSINKRSEAVQRQQSALSSLVQDSISGIRVIKSYNRETQREAQFTSESDNYKTTALSLVKVDALFMPIITLLVGLSTVLTIYIGGIKVNAGELEVKQIFTFVFYVNMLTWPFASVGWVSSLVQKAEASQERINAFLNEEPEIQNPNDAALKVDGKIEFKDVSFTYPESGVKALKNLSFTIEPGETLAVTGRTGSGKSTLANLLLRHYDAASGQILIDGKPINTLNLNALRKQIGYVPQEVFLFSDSIRNNIGFGMDGLGDNFDKTVTSAALDAGVHDNIVDFPKGYETKLGERGLNLSGGQKQRISIARAIIKDPAILIFDDCLSAVDTQTEELILGNLRKLMQGKSSIIISHRISTIKHADKIIVLDQGSIVEAGTHAELLANGGMYARIYRKQLLEASTEQA